MVTLNDYLYSGDTMFKILKNYSQDLKAEAKQTNNEIDLIHANFLIQIRELLEHNDFLTTQSQKIREFYIHMAKEYPLLAFNFIQWIFIISFYIFFVITDPAIFGFIFS